MAMKGAKGQMLLRRILAAVIIAIGLALIGLGVASATVWRSADHITVSADSEEAPITLVLPGVLGLVDENVTITATADGDQPIVLTFARAADVMAWVGETRNLQIEGLVDFETLATNLIEGTEATALDPRGSDLWTDEIEGTGELTLDLTADNGQVIMLAATDGTDPAPELSFTWPVEVETPYMVPLIAAGSVLALLGLAWLAYQLIVASELRKREAAQAEIEKKEQRQSLQTQVFRTDQPMTRRQLRDMQRRFKEEDPRHAADGPVTVTAGAVGAGVLPGVADPGKYRAMRHVPVDDSAEIPVVRDDAPAPTAQDPVIEPAQEPEASLDDGEAESIALAPPPQTRTSWRSLWEIKEEK